jgi:hypothetical protein
VQGVGDLVAHAQRGNGYFRDHGGGLIQPAHILHVDVAVGLTRLVDLDRRRGDVLAQDGVAALAQMPNNGGVDGL